MSIILLISVKLSNAVSSFFPTRFFVQDDDTPDYTLKNLGTTDPITQFFMTDLGEFVKWIFTMTFFALLLLEVYKVVKAKVFNKDSTSDKWSGGKVASRLIIAVIVLLFTEQTLNMIWDIMHALGGIIRSAIHTFFGGAEETN